jgi:hypothetical protein
MRTGGFDVPEERIETNAAKTTVVRVRRPPEASPVEFVALMRAWLEHQCILLADLKVVRLANAEGLFDAEFDNPRDADLFARRFGGQLILPRTSPRTGRNNPGRLLQFRGRLKAQKEANPLDQDASAIIGARAT